MADLPTEEANQNIQLFTFYGKLYSPSGSTLTTEIH